jgi:hypothetical protein
MRTVEMQLEITKFMKKNETTRKDMKKFGGGQFIKV